MGTSTSPSSSTRLLTPAEAAKHLRIPLDRLDALRTDGCGPEWGQWRSTIRYSVDELNTWLATASD